MNESDEPTQEELDENTLAKLDAIAHPERFTAEPGQMVSAEEMADREEEAEE